jgi:predicted membrane metal-binding protein
MSSIFLLCLSCERNPLFLNSLFLAGCVILLIDTRQLFSPSFQLSFLSVFFIFLLFPLLDPGVLLKKWSLTTIPAGRWVHGTAVSAVVSFCAWLGTAPLLVCAFGNVSWIGIIANIIIIPLAALVMAYGFTFLCLSWCVPAARVVAAAGDGLVFVFLYINRSFACMRGVSVSGVHIHPALAIGIYLVLLLLVAVLKGREKR